MPFGVVDSNKWIEDLLDEYDNKILTREELIKHISDAGFDAYKMGYEQKAEDLSNDELAAKGAVFVGTGEVRGATFEAPKQEWFKERVSIIERDNSTSSIRGFKVIEGTKRQGIGIEDSLGFYCNCHICEGFVPGRTSCKEGVDKIE